MSLPLRQRVKDAPIDLEELIARCTKRDRLARWPDAGALHESMLAVRRRMRGEKPSARTETVGEMPASSAMIASKASKASKPISLQTANECPRRLRSNRSEPVASPKRNAALLTLSSPGSEPPASLDALDLDFPPPPPEPIAPPPPSKRSSALDDSSNKRKSPAPASASRPIEFPKASAGPIFDPSESSRSMFDPSGIRERDHYDAKEASLISPAIRRHGRRPRRRTIAGWHLRRFRPSSIRARRHAPSRRPPRPRPKTYLTTLCPRRSISGVERKPREAAPAGDARTRPQDNTGGADAARLVSQRRPSGSSLPSRFLRSLDSSPSSSSRRSGRPIGRALRGDSTLASGVLAVIALVAAAALCARAVAR